MSKNYPTFLVCCYIVCQFTGVVLADGDEYIQCKDPTTKYDRYFEGRSLAMCGGGKKGHYEEAINHLCPSTYMYKTGVPYTKLFKGRNLQEACASEDRDNLPTYVVVAYLLKGKDDYMPPAIHWNAAIFIGCDGNTGIKVADQDCNRKFNERKVTFGTSKGSAMLHIVSGEDYYFVTMDPNWVAQQEKEHAAKEAKKAKAKEETERKRAAKEAKEAKAKEEKEAKRAAKEAKSASTGKKGFLSFGF